MNKAKLIAGIILIFILGGVAGGLTVRLFDQNDTKHKPHWRASLSERVDMIMTRLGEELKLTPAQVVEIRPIVERTEKSISELNSVFRPRIRSLHDQGFADMREKLDPDQQAELDEMLKRIKRFRRKPPQG